MSRRSTVVSIGYQQRTPDELVQLLREHHVRAVIDVRELPLSRRKGFSKTPLSGQLSAAGIDYVHLRRAGNPYRTMDTTVSQCLALYRHHLQLHPDVVALASSQVNGSPVAFLCFERKHADCHRSVLIDAMLALNSTLRVITIE
jgi:uncharacterized protein (DUF488 family)